MPTDAPLEYHQFDTAPPIVEVLQERNDAGQWVAMDLEGKTVRLLAQHRRNGRRFGGEVVPDENSRCEYDLQVTDLVDPGEYRYEWEVTAPDGSRMTIPRRGYYELNVTAKSGAVA